VLGEQAALATGRATSNVAYGEVTARTDLDRLDPDTLRRFEEALLLMDQIPDDLEPLAAAQIAYMTVLTRREERRRAAQPEPPLILPAEPALRMDRPMPERVVIVVEQPALPPRRRLVNARG
jgi:hypothetical protein